MVFWIGAFAIALTIAVVAALRLLRNQASPAWPTAATFGLAGLAAFGAAMQATIASLETTDRQPQQTESSATARVSGQAPADHGDVANGEAPASSFDSLVERLENSLKEDPDDANRWALLGRSYVAMGRVPDAVKAFKEAVDRTEPADPGLLGEYAEALAAAAGGRIAGEPEAVFAQILTLLPDDPRARYYMALAQAEKGDVAAARDSLTALLETAPPDAPWRQTVFERIQELGGNPKIPDDVATAPAAPAAPGPTAEQVQAAQEMSPEDRQQMIRGMVDGLAERLAAEPDDFGGWLRLANAYVVLGEQAKAADALESALKLEPENVGLLIQFAETRIAADDGKIMEPAMQALKKADALEPANTQVYWRLGQAAAASGDKETARRMWTDALSKLEDADPLKAEVSAALGAL